MTNQISGLDEFHPGNAYHLGRLLTIFQHIQDLADERVNTTYVSRYYSSASTTPCLVMPRIWSTARHRLRAIKSSRVRDDIEALIVRCHTAISGSFPKRLSVVEQSEFQLGFFHQKPGLPELDMRRRLPTRRGEPVKSSGEQFLADRLFDLGVNYVIEEPFEAVGAKWPLKPDFTVWSDDRSRLLIIEYAGMGGDESYDKQWSHKTACYRRTTGLRTFEECAIDGKVDRITWITFNPKDLQSKEGTTGRLVMAVEAVRSGKLEVNPAASVETPW